MKVPTVVVGYDGSENAHRAIDAAVDAITDDGVVHVVTAFDMPSSGEVASMIQALPDEFKQTYDALAAPRAHLHDAEDILEKCGVAHKGHFVDDHAAAAILDVADRVDADLIVVGSRGLRHGTRFLRGSVSSRVASHAKHSFLVIQ